MITLNVHSSLEVVGFIAAIGAKLTEKKIGVNHVGGLLQVGREEQALQALTNLRSEAEDMVAMVKYRLESGNFGYFEIA
jgi:hypothetical protein